VQQAVAELGYTPNRAARNLRTRTSSLIGMRVTPPQEGTANTAMDRFLRSLVTASEEAGYHVLLFPGDDLDPVKGYANLLRSTAVDAFVVTDTYLGNPQAEWLAGHGAPFVAFGRPWGEGTPAHPWVDVDGAYGTRLATEHLQQRGHTRIAWLGWTADSPIGEDRRSGWADAMGERGLSTHELAVRVEDTVEAGARAAAAMLDRVGPTAFVCASDTLAVGVLHTLWIRQLAPGRDIAVVGFDDSQVAQVYPVGLTSVRQPLEEAAVEVVRLLRGLIGPGTGDAVSALLRPTLAVRGSS
jgi:LacI family transcriptional regulator